MQTESYVNLITVVNFFVSIFLFMIFTNKKIGVHQVCVFHDNNITIKSSYSITRQPKISLNHENNSSKNIQLYKRRKQRYSFEVITFTISTYELQISQMFFTLSRPEILFTIPTLRTFSEKFPDFTEKRKKTIRFLYKRTCQFHEFENKNEVKNVSEIKQFVFQNRLNRQLLMFSF